MTPEELEALADRVEAGETGREIDALIFIAITPGAMLARDRIPNAVEPDVQCWVPGQTERGEFLMPPAYRRSLDAVAQVMPAGWVVAMDIQEDAARVVAGHRYLDFAKSHAPTECAARVAAGLRARAHVLRNGGAA